MGNRYRIRLFVKIMRVNFVVKCTLVSNDSMPDHVDLFVNNKLSGVIEVKYEGIH